MEQAHNTPGSRVCTNGWRRCLVFERPLVSVHKLTDYVAYCHRFVICNNCDACGNILVQNLFKIFLWMRAPFSFSQIWCEPQRQILWFRVIQSTTHKWLIFECLNYYYYHCIFMIIIHIFLKLFVFFYSFILFFLFYFYIDASLILLFSIVSF